MHDCGLQWRDLSGTENIWAASLACEKVRHGFHLAGRLHPQLLSHCLALPEEGPSLMPSVVQGLRPMCSLQSLLLERPAATLICLWPSRERHMHYANERAIRPAFKSVPPPAKHWLAILAALDPSIRKFSMLCLMGLLSRCALMRHPINAEFLSHLLLLILHNS